MTNLEIAEHLVHSFATGDTKIAEKYLDQRYKQHNLNFANGGAAFVQAVKQLQDADEATTVETIRKFEEQDYVILQNVYNFAGAGLQVGFDVFRFSDGKIVEHWDNLAPLMGMSPSGHTQIDGVIDVVNVMQTAENKKVVADFVRDVLRGENPARMSIYFEGDQYVQHNVDIADGISGLQKALNEMASQGVEMTYDQTHLILGQGNFVLVISEGELGHQHVAFYDLFRVEALKISEHWDIVEAIPPETKWANSNGKF
jgi:predicted SnoaL-like aldol condensation-catalyzing enzyme